MKQSYMVMSVNVGQPKQVEKNNKRCLTGIDKRPVTQPVYLSKLHLAGDAQADLEHHGGADKAVCVYPYYLKGSGGENKRLNKEAGLV
ncbi:hypothetical protein GCM10010965_30590 [Caldalkalibacillus thermarum]|uniref:hypothetical protein n=1 Tax=Caldalkalibacillus thermarum TaxID=296745 RepID=UPI001662ECEB|nr:hypothetical protein [Caldalkalibacillus thermarum]GGK35503.1 hypothetical protein GCM10010965_30590 [Caldalkalibacillus thermarum]